MRPPLPSRREFVSGGLAGLIAASAGCLGVFADGSASDAFGTESDRVLSLRLLREDGTLRDRFVQDLGRTGPDWDEAAFAAARNGTAYTTQYRKPFFARPDDPVYAERDGTYYELGSVVVGEASATHPVVRLFEADDETAAVDAAQLPEVDQRAVHVAYMAARARGSEGGAPWGLVQRGGYVYRRDDAVEASRLLASDGPATVSYHDRVYRVEVATEEFHEPVYRATADPVAESPAAMEAILRAKFVDARFSRDDRSPAAREVLRAARTDGYHESHPYSAGFEEVLRALGERPYLDGNVENDGGVGADEREMVRYDGVYYEYYLRFRPAPPG